MDVMTVLVTSHIHSTNAKFSMIPTSENMSSGDRMKYPLFK